MKFIALIEYDADQKKVDAVFPQHREYLRELLGDGRLVAAGPFTEHKGAVYVYEAESREQAEEWVKGDPFGAAGIVVKWQIHPLLYWSAKEMVGSK